MAERTETGFRTKDLLVELLTDGWVRVLNTRNGNYVEVSQSDKGVKSFVRCDHMTPEQLKSYLGANVELSGPQAALSPEGPARTQG